MCLGGGRWRNKDNMTDYVSKRKGSGPKQKWFSQVYKLVGGTLWMCVCASEGTMINVQSKRKEKNIEIGWINSPDSVEQAEKKGTGTRGESRRKASGNKQKFRRRRMRKDKWPKAREQSKRPRNPESNKINKLRAECHLSMAKGIRCGKPKTQFWPRGKAVEMEMRNASEHTAKMRVSKRTKSAEAREN